MRRRDHRGSREGFTLVEILVVVAIFGFLATMAVSSFLAMSEKYKVEAETKQLFADLMDARGRAAQRNRFHFVRFTPPTAYATYADSNPVPDGNETYDAGIDDSVVNVTVTHAITSAFFRVLDNVSVANVAFNRNGIPDATGQLRFASSANPDYDCITIRQTRIKMGKFSAGICVEK